VKSSASSTRKKVVIRKLDKGLVKGYVNPSSYLGPSGVEVLDREGRLQGIPLEELKGVFFVRDFKGDPQHLERKLFQSRPRHSGLWVRVTFRDKEVLDGIIPNNLLDLDPSGFSIIPPDAYSNNLKIFIPRRALTAMEVIGVISDVRSRRNSHRGSRKGLRAEDVSAPIEMPPRSRQSGTK
jgi:uncharacterized protein DUF6982